MYRIDNSTAVPNASGVPAPSAPGVNVNGYFTAGNPATATPATIVDQDWANAIQEEISGVIERAGITLNKANRAQLLQAIFSMAGKNQQIFTSSGNFTVPANVTRIRIRAWGAGAGGAGGFSGQGVGGGGGGAYVEGFVTVTPAQIIPVAIGIGGAGGVTASSGAAGGTTTIAGFSAGGGLPGSAATPWNGGNGGVPSGGTINLNGSHGGGGATGAGLGGYGGAAPMGGGGDGASQGAPGNQPGNPGGGGAGGGGLAAATGSTGANGFVVIEW